jgi:hypothetical protein
MATADAVLTSGADFLQKGHLDGNQRRVNNLSSEDTIVGSAEYLDAAHTIETKAPLNNKQLVPYYQVVPYSGEEQTPSSQTSPPTLYVHPIIAQAVDTSTCLALGVYLGTLCYMIPSALAAGQSPLGPCLFLAAKGLNYGK